MDLLRVRVVLYRCLERIVYIRKELKMIHSEDIKRIFGGFSKGVPMTVGTIQASVARAFPLTKDDWEPYTKIRATNYPIWKHRVQSVLSEYKKKQKVGHNPKTNSYSF